MAACCNALYEVTHQFLPSRSGQSTSNDVSDMFSDVTDVPHCTYSKFHLPLLSVAHVLYTGICL